jgi:creatinine amidohydrolase
MMKEKKEYRLDLLNWQQVRDIVPEKTDMVILPVGTMEAHGATGLGTDSILAEEIADRMAEKLSCLVAPTINYGITNSLLAYPGSMSHSADTFINYVREVLDGLVRIGFDKIIIMNGHGGQSDELKGLVTDFSRRSGKKMILFHWWEFILTAREKAYGLGSSAEGGHAALEETAMMIAFCPEGVQEGLYSEDLAYRVYPGVKVMPSPGSIIIGEDSPLPDFNDEKADEFASLVVDELVDTTKNIVSQWKRTFGN